MLGISSEARFTENVRADFVACLAACLEFYHFISLSYGGQIQSWHLDSKPLFFCMFLWISQWQGLLENKQEQG